MKRILVTNDDGIQASGITSLVKALSRFGEVYVVAPLGQQSAKSQSITFLTTISVTEVEMEGAAFAYAVDGTPTDCVKWAIGNLQEMKGIEFDYLFSGINLGMNTGLAAYYSGTISAAIEGELNGVKSIALSVGDHEATEFEYIISLIPMLMRMAGSVARGIVISVNAPELPADQIKGYKVVEAAPFGYGVLYMFEDAGGGEYQMSGVPGRKGEGITYDMDAVAAGYAAISPLQTSFADIEALEDLEWAADL